MAQADGWPQSDVKADIDVAPSANDAPSQHGAAADKYYQLLSLHGDTVSSRLCRTESQHTLAHLSKCLTFPGGETTGDHRASVLRQLRRLETLPANYSSVEPQGKYRTARCISRTLSVVLSLESVLDVQVADPTCCDYDKRTPL